MAECKAETNACEYMLIYFDRQLLLQCGYYRLQGRMLQLIYKLTAPGTKIYKIRCHYEFPVSRL
jgi:hypothetical protein